MVAFVRAHGSEGERLHYKVMRRVRSDGAFTFLRRAGAEPRIRTMESLDVPTTQPHANVRAITDVT